MAMRGIRKPGARTVTSAVRGHLPDRRPTRAEAMSLIRVGEPVDRAAGGAADVPRPGSLRRDGRAQRDARTPSPTAAGTPTSTRPSRTGSRWRAAGADLVDVGGESTRPGAHRVDAAEEAPGASRSIATLAADGVPVSVDTTRAAVAEAAAGRRRARRQRRVRRAGRPGRWRAVVARPACPGSSCTGAGTAPAWTPGAATSTWSPRSGAELAARVDAAVAAGVDAGRIVLDPGLGFAKTAEHNWALLRRLDGWSALGLPGAGRRVPQARSSAGCWPARRRAPPAGRPRGRRPPRSPRWPPRPGPGACGCTRSRRPWMRWRSPRRSPGRGAGPGPTAGRAGTG